VKALLAGLLCLALAVPALASSINIPVVQRDANGTAIRESFTNATGDSVQFVYSVKGPATVDTLDLNIDLSFPGWFNFQLPAETNALTAWFRFKEIDETAIGTNATYTWGDWVPYYLGGSYRRDAFNIGLSDSLQMCVVGSAYGIMDVYYWTEEYRD
jgi:hypothetical protein